MPALARCTRHAVGARIGHRCVWIEYRYVDWVQVLDTIFSKCIFPIRHLPIGDTNLDLLTKN